MKKRELYSNLPKEVAIEKIKIFLIKLSKMYVFKKIKFKWKKSSSVSISFVLKGRKEKDSAKISIDEKGENTKISIDGEKIFTLEYFLMELNKIL